MEKFKFSENNDVYMNTVGFFPIVSSICSLFELLSNPGFEGRVIVYRGCAYYFYCTHTVFNHSLNYR